MADVIEEKGPLIEHTDGDGADEDEEVNRT